MRRALVLLPVLALAACQSDSDPGPGEVTRGEARQLNEAAAATDINAVTAAPDNAAQ
jgi:hypothetical protein